MSRATATEVDFSVGEWRVYPRLCRIERGGNAVHLTPRSMEVLVYLAGSDGAVVSRGELLDAIWPRMEVSQDALTQCIVELRKAFGDSAKTPAVIETIPKVGIRLIPNVARDGAVLPATAAAVAKPLGPAAGRETPRGNRHSILVVTLAVGAAWAVAVWQGGQPVDAGAPDPGLPATPRAIALAHYESGNRYFNRNNDRNHLVPLATHQYQLAVDADPSFAAGWAQLGMAHTAHYFLGIDRTPARLALAEAAIDTALRLDDSLPEGHLAKANYLHRCIGDVEGAIEEFTKAERGLPASPALYLNRSSLWRRTGDWARAIGDLNRAISLEPANVLYVRQQYINHLFTREYDDAAKILDRVASLTPDDASVFTDRLILQLVAGRDTRAALQSDSANPNARQDDARAFVYTRWLAAIFERDYERAEQILLQHAQDEIVDFDLGHVAAPIGIYLARTRALAGRANEAMQYFNEARNSISERLSKAAALDPRTEAFYRLALAEADVGLGRNDDALQALARAHELMPRSLNRMDFSALQLSR